MASAATTPDAAWERARLAFVDAEAEHRQAELAALALFRIVAAAGGSSPLTPAFRTKLADARERLDATAAAKDAALMKWRAVSAQ